MTTDWIPMTDWPHDWPTIAALRQIVVRAQARGQRLPWLRRLEHPRRLLVSPSLFQAWIDDQDQASAKLERSATETPAP